MNERLRHDFKSFLRRIQISQKKLFVFVEGIEYDPYFYEQICSQVTSKYLIDFEIVRATELSDNIDGGKQSLISFHDFLRGKGNLFGEFEDKKHASIFILDKDLDDLMRKKKRSDYIIYTKYYSIENHIVVHGDLIQSATVATSIQKKIIKNKVVASKEWRKNLAESWKEWLTLCLVALKHRANCGCQLRRYSPLKGNSNDITNPDSVYHHLNNICRSLGISFDDAKELYIREKKRVEKYLAEDRIDIIFRGKWYPRLFEKDIKNIAGRIPYQRNNIGIQILKLNLKSLDFSDSWSRHFTKPVEKIVKKVI